MNRGYLNTEEVKYKEDENNEIQEERKIKENKMVLERKKLEKIRRGERI